MELLNEKEALKCNGGAKISAGIIVVISAIGSFICGILSGISNPIKCNAR